MSNTYTPAPPTIQDRALDHAEDTRAIHQVIADIEKAVNNNDAEGAVQHFAANGSSVGVTGARVVGHDELLDAHRQAFSSFLQDQRARYTVDDIVFLSPDIAIAHKRARALDTNGTPTGADPAMVALYVLAKRNGRWWIAARQNTLTAPRS